MKNMQIHPNFEETKLVSITRQDLNPGYQVVQTAHAIADFAYDHPDIFRQWKSESNSIITLSTKDEASLIDLYSRLKEKTSFITAFREPDIQDQMTAICLYATVDIRKMLSNLPLALREKKVKPVTV